MATQVPSICTTRGMPFEPQAAARARVKAEREAEREAAREAKRAHGRMLDEMNAAWKARARDRGR